MIRLRWIPVVFVLLSLTLLGGCGGLSGGNATLILQNDTTQYTIDEVYVYALGASDVGGDLLSGTIAPTQNDSFTVAAGDMSINFNDTSNGGIFGLNMTFVSGQEYTISFDDDDAISVP